MIGVSGSFNERHIAPSAETRIAHPVEILSEDPWTGVDYDVILLDCDCPEGFALRSVLQAMGVQVFLGAHSVPSDSSPLIMLHARHRHRKDVSERMACARQIFPSSTVLFVTGDVVAPFSTTEFDDARVILGAVGISFVT